MGIFELSQGNPEAAPRTASATMQIEDFGARRVKSKLRDVEGSLKRLGMVIYNLAKSHYTFQKTFRVVQPNNDLDEFTVNQLYDDKSKEVMAMQNDLSVGQYDIKVVGNSTLPSNRWGRFEYYKELYQLQVIDQVELLKQTDVADMEGVLERADQRNKMQSQIQQLTEQNKKLKGDLQTAERESKHDRKRVEIKEFEKKLAKAEAKIEMATQLHGKRSADELDKLKEAVREAESESNKEPKRKVVPIPN